jgi:hypothetical protein
MTSIINKRVAIFKKGGPCLATAESLVGFKFLRGFVRIKADEDLTG